MAEFRRTTDEFKSTWEREVNFEENETAAPSIPHDPAERIETSDADLPAAPEIKSIDSAEFDKIRAENAAPAITEEDPGTDKKNWF
jgi:hypothetical protein